MTVTAMPPNTKTTAAEPTEKKGRRKKLIVALVLLLAVVGGGWFFLKPAPAAEPVAGEVKTLEAVQLNLAGGHYLRLGLALQLAEGQDVEGAKALDAAIALFSGLEVADVARGERREKLRVELLEHLQEKYGDDALLEVYFTEFVTQ